MKNRCRSFPLQWHVSSCLQDCDSK